MKQVSYQPEIWGVWAHTSHARTKKTSHLSLCCEVGQLQLQVHILVIHTSYN